MSKTPVGSRVGAILSSDGTTAHLLGFGVYDGHHEPPFGPMGMPKDEYEALLTQMKDAGQVPADYVHTNPRITLDDGRIVWGAQCWWGPEDAVRKMIDGLQIVHAVLPDQPAAAVRSDDCA